MTRLYLDGQESGTSVPGYVIEAQYEWQVYSLLITSYDCLYEEANSFVLLDEKLQIVSRRSLGGWLATFLLEEHAPVAENSLQLRYWGDLHYRLSIEPRFFVLKGRPTLKLRKMRV